MTPGARSKFGAPCSNLRSFVSNYTAVALKYNTYDIVRTFWRPVVIQHSHSDSAPGELCPCSPSLRPWLLRAVLRLNKTIVRSSNQRPTGTLGRKGEKCSIRRNFAPLWGKRIGKFCRAMVLLKQLAQTYRQVFSWVFKILSKSLPLRTLIKDEWSQIFQTPAPLLVLAFRPLLLLRVWNFQALTLTPVYTPKTTK